jgi:predicted DNA-binding transcriptional regulator AlpA
MIETVEHSTYLRAKDAAKYLGVGRTTFYKWSKRDDFPKPIKMSEITILYKKNELDEWMEKRRA